MDRVRVGQVFAKNLAMALRERGLSQAEVAKRLNVASSSICGWTSGSLPNIVVGQALAKVLGVSIEQLLSCSNSVDTEDL